MHLRFINSDRQTLGLADADRVPLVGEIVSIIRGEPSGRSTVQMRGKVVSLETVYTVTSTGETTDIATLVEVRAP